MATKTPRTTIEKKKNAPVKSTTRKTGRPAATEATARKPRRTVTTRREETPAPEVQFASASTPKRRPLFQSGTWISIFMLAALIGLAFYLNRQKETKAAETTPTIEKTFIFTEADGLVSSIEIKPAEGETVKIARNTENVWAVILPIEAEADQGMAEAAASQLMALPISSQIEQGKSPDIFGLDKPAHVITVEFKDGKKRALEIGDATPSGNGYYARLDQGKILIIEISGVEALLQLQTFPPYLNTPVPTIEATATPAP